MQVNVVSKGNSPHESLTSFAYTILSPTASHLVDELDRGTTLARRQVIRTEDQLLHLQYAIATCHCQPQIAYEGQGAVSIVWLMTNLVGAQLTGLDSQHEADGVHEVRLAGAIGADDRSEVLERADHLRSHPCVRQHRQQYTKNDDKDARVRLNAGPFRLLGCLTCVPG